MLIEGAKPRILVVDDSSFVADATREALAQRGLETRVATTLLILNRLLVSWSPTLVLLDVNMPGIDGTTICRSIRERLTTQDVPVFLYSDMPEWKLSELVPLCGADGFISKRRGMIDVADRVLALCEEIVW